MSSPARVGSHALQAGQNNLGSAPFRRTMPGRRSMGESQADFRRPAVMYDQHGRQWSCSVEIRSGMPTGLIANDFAAPWLPDQNHLVVNPQNTSELWIDYGAMYRDRHAALSHYHTQAVQLATDKGWAIPEKGKYGPDVRRVLGNPPRPLEPVVAAAKGNPWILGFSDVPDPRLVEFVTPVDVLERDWDLTEDYGADGYEAAISGVSFAVGSGYEARSVVPAVVEQDDVDAEAAAVSELGDDYASFDGSEDADDLLSIVDEVEEAADPEALGGRTIKPAKQAFAARQAPRRPQQTSKHKGQKKAMKSLRAATDGRRSLADGAQPAVSGYTSDHELSE